jgi:hypothetical protein
MAIPLAARLAAYCQNPASRSTAGSSW